MIETMSTKSKSKTLVFRQNTINMKEYTREINKMKQKTEIQMAIEEYKEFEQEAFASPDRNSLSSDANDTGTRKLSQNALSSFIEAELKKEKSPLSDPSDKILIADNLSENDE